MVGRIDYVMLTSDNVGSFTDSSTSEGPVYTRDFLKGTLQLIGCKPRFAEKLSEHAFKEIETLLFGAGKRTKRLLWRMHPRGDGQFWVSIPRKDFNKFMLQCIETVYQRSSTVEADWKIATSLREHRKGVTILLCGTSGTGKSTLASLLATRLRITTVISTDSVRNLMRSLISAEDNPLIYASSYDAGHALQTQHQRLGQTYPLSDVKLAVKGFKAQSECVLENLEKVITECESRNESIICEGVHLSLNFVIRLMRHHPSIVPFLIYIRDEQKHIERFSVRAKYMTRDSSKNRYISHLGNVRCIQDFLIRKADLHLIPKVNNTNVDRSVAAIHQTTFACLRRIMKGESLYDANSNTARVVSAEYKSVLNVSEMKTKGALEAIRSKAETSGPSGSFADGVDARVASSNSEDEEVRSDSTDNHTEAQNTDYGSLMESTTEWEEHDE